MDMKLSNWDLLISIPIKVSIYIRLSEDVYKRQGMDGIDLYIRGIIGNSRLAHHGKFNGFPVN